MAQSSGSQDEGSGARRGRRPIRPDPRSGPVALLAHRLWELKERAGDPSFADMASRLGAAASKSSLAAAARGSALPTWETTWEFVRVLAVERLGQDAEEARREWRAQWEQAARAVQSDVGPDAGPDAGSDAGAGAVQTDTTAHSAAADAGVAAGRSETEAVMAEQPEPQARPFPTRDPAATPTGNPASSPASSPAGNPVVIAAAAIAAAGVAVAVFALSPLAGSTGESGNDAAARPTAPAQPVSPHDDSVFERDVTVPDGTVVKPGTRFTKVWRIRNTGTLPWQGRYLTRLNDTPCRAPERVPIRTVQPGESVDISVRVRAAESPGRCKIYWKMTDEAGQELLAAKKPIFLDVVIA